MVARTARDDVDIAACNLRADDSLISRGAGGFGFGEANADADRAEIADGFNALDRAHRVLGCVNRIGNGQARRNPRHRLRARIASTRRSLGKRGRRLNASDQRRVDLERDPEGGGSENRTKLRKLILNRWLLRVEFYEHLFRKSH